MSGNEFIIRVVNDFTGAILKQAKDFDKVIQKEVLDHKKGQNKKLNADKIYQKQVLALDKARLSSLTKNDDEYYRLKKSIKYRELKMVKGISEQERDVLIRKNSAIIDNEKKRYAESRRLAVKLQDTLKSVFQRAVFYTGIYKTISLVNNAFKDWIKTNIDLEYALAKVNTISKVTTTQMSVLKDLALETGRSLVDESNALYEINSSGRKGADAMNILTTATRASVAGFTNATNAADVLTDVLNAYHMNSAQSEVVTDKLLKTVELGKLKWEDYQGQLGNVLPSAYALGLSLDELLGTLGTLTLSGLKFNKATTGMRNLMVKFLKPTKAMDKALISLNDNLGTSFGSIQDAIKARGFITVLQDLNGVLDETDLTTIDLFNNIRGLTSGLIVMSDAGKKADEVTGHIVNSTGTLQEKYDVMSNTIVEAKNRLSTAFESLGVDLFSFGDALIGILDGLRGFVKFLKLMTPLIKGVAVTLAGITLALIALGGKILFVTYVMPLLKSSWDNMLISARKTPITMSLANQAFSTTTVAATATKVSVISLSTAFSALTLGLPILLTLLQSWSSWINKQRAAQKATNEKTKEAIQLYKEMRGELNLLSNTNPFQGMNNQSLNAQILENNKLLKRRTEIIDKINELEREKLVYEVRSGKYAKTRLYGIKEDLTLQKSLLFQITGPNDYNLKVFHAMSREQDYRLRGLTEEQKAVEELKLGYSDVVGRVESMDLTQLKKMRTELEKSYSDADQDRYGIFGFVNEEAMNRIQKALLIINGEIQSQWAATQAKKEEEEKASNDKILAYFKKYRDDRLKMTLAGQIKIIEAEKEAAKKTKEYISGSLKDKEDFERYYNAKKLKITKDYYKKLKEADEKAHKGWKDRLIKANDWYEFWSKKNAEDKVKWEDDQATKRAELEDRYLNNSLEELKQKYDAEKLLAGDNKLLLIEIEKAYQEEKSQIEFEAWTKQHEYLALWVNAFQEGTAAVGDFFALQMGALVSDAKVTKASLNAIWVSWKNSMIALIGQVIAKMLILKALELAIGGLPIGWLGTGLSYIYKGLGGSNLDDAIVQNGVITPFRKDDVVAIGTNMYGTRSGASGYNNKALEAKLDKVIDAINLGTLVNQKKEIKDTVLVYSPETVNDLNRQGDMINRNIG